MVCWLVSSSRHVYRCYNLPYGRPEPFLTTTATHPRLVNEAVLGGDDQAGELGAFFQDELHRRRRYRALIQGKRRQPPHTWRNSLCVGWYVTKTMGGEGGVFMIALEFVTLRTREGRHSPKVVHLQIKTFKVCRAKQLIHM